MNLTQIQASLALFGEGERALLSFLCAFDDEENTVINQVGKRELQPPKLLDSRQMTARKIAKTCSPQKLNLSMAEKVMVGQIFFLNGDVYNGPIKNNLPYGKGKYTFANKGFYEGDFFKGSLHGNGTLLDFQGNFKYVGEFQNGFPNGYGTLSSLEGRVIFEGNFLNGDPQV